MTDGGQRPVPVPEPGIALRAMGSLHVGGRWIERTGLPIETRRMAAGGPPVRIDPNGRYRIEQTYAQYHLVARPRSPIPVLFLHGGAMTGAAWETTPDGRPGWLPRFLAHRRDCYVVDAVERGRSGFAPVPDVWPLPVVQTLEDVFVRFRIGSRDHDGALAPFPGTRFPVAALDAMVSQLVPRWTHTDEATIAGHLALLERIGPADVVCHSQSGMLALRAARRRPDLFRSIVALEPASVPDRTAGLDDIETGPAGADADAIPTLILMGDFIDRDDRWPATRDRIVRHAAARPATDLISLPAIGIHGNTHMLMMDDNSDEIATRVLDWLDARAA